MSSVAVQHSTYRDKPDWLVRALRTRQRSQLEAPRKSQQPTPQRVADIPHLPSLNQSSPLTHRAVNPTPNAGLHNKSPTKKKPNQRLHGKRLTFLRESTFISTTYHAKNRREYTIVNENPKRARSVERQNDDEKYMNGHHETYSMPEFKASEGEEKSHHETRPHEGQDGHEWSLPPLDGGFPYSHERTMYLEYFPAKKPDLTPWGNRGSMLEVDQHWHLKPRRIRPDTESRIVSHLKKQFVSRLEKRFQRLLAEESDSEEESDSTSQPPVQPHSAPGRAKPEGNHLTMPGHWKRPRHGPSHEEPSGGGGVGESGSLAAARTHSRPATRCENPAGERSRKTSVERLPLSLNRPAGGEGLMRNATTEHHFRHLKCYDEETMIFTNREEDRLPKIADVSRGDSPATRPLPEEKVFDLTGLSTRDPMMLPSLDTQEQEGPEESDDDDVPINEVPCSPVPTPFIFSRPQTTRSSRMLSVRERLRLVIDEGRVHVRFPERRRAFSIFINSTGRDTEVERSALIKYTFLVLRTYCKTRGLDLDVIDLNWGTSELVLASQDQSELAETLIHRCHDSAKGVAFITMLGQKHGEPRVPRYIEQREFEQILSSLQQEKQKQLVLAQQRIEEFERLRQEVEEEADIVASDEARENTGSEAITQKQGALSRGTSKASNKSTGVAPSRAGETREGADIKAGNNSKVPKLQLTRHSTKDERKAAELANGTLSPLTSFREQVRGAALKRLSIKGMKRDYNIPPDDLFPEPELIESWYELDSNSLPPVYRLKPITVHLPDIVAKDSQKRKEARHQWHQTSTRLLTQLCHYAREAGLGSDQLRKYSQTSMEMELGCALLGQSGEEADQCLWLRRDIQDVCLTDPKAREYMDVTEGPEHALDREKSKQLRQLQETLETTLPGENIRRFAVNWSPQGITPDTSRYYASYAVRMCRDTFQLLRERIDCALEEEDALLTLEGECDQEVLDHTAFAQNRAFSFYGRRETLSVVKKYLRSSSRLPLVLHGDSGCGKSSLLARAALDAHSWAGAKQGVVVRFVGLTSSSVNIRLLLRHLLLQLCAIYDQDPKAVPHDYVSLSNLVADYMSKATTEKPLVIFIDSLHCLSDDHSGRKLQWLPVQLPKHTKLIVSTHPDTKYECFPELQTMLAENKDNIIEIPPLTSKDMNVIVTEWFNKSQRTLTSDQRLFLLEQAKKCPQPLYLFVLFTESIKWSSFTPIGAVKFGRDCRMIAQTVFARLEKDHGEPLVRRALGYISATRNGIASSELEDVLSLDEVALSEIILFCHPPLRRIPSLLWQRLKLDLSPYIEETQADGTITIKWLHTPFHDAATDRYLKSRDLAPSYHKPLAEYFMNTWKNQAKPLPGSDQGEYRYVMEQGLCVHPEFADDLKDVETHTSKFNYRMLNELPFQLLKSAQMDKLKMYCLCNFQFLACKINASSIRAFFEDVQMALNQDANDKDLNLLADALRLSKKHIVDNTIQLSNQLAGRLVDLIRKDKPVAPNDPVVYPYMKPFMIQLSKYDQPSLMPTRSCLIPPSGLFYDCLAGHSELIVAVVFTPEGKTVATASKDNTIKIWDIAKRRVVLTIYGVGAFVYQLCFASRNKVLVSSEISCVRFWNAKTGVLMQTVETKDPCSITVVNETQFLVAIGHGTGAMMTIDAETFTMKANLCVKERQHDVVHKDESVIVAQTFPLHSTQVFYAFRSQEEAIVRESASGGIVYRLECRNGSSIQGLGCTQAYFICAAKYNDQAVGQECMFLEYFTAMGGKHQKSARGCERCVGIREILVNSKGTHVIALCPFAETNTSNIAVWNVATDDHKHVVEHNDVSRFGAFLDINCVLTTSIIENYLRIWDLSGLVNKKTQQHKAQEGICDIIAAANDENQIITKYNKTGTIGIWNIHEEKETTVERSIADVNDVLLVNEHKAVILGDKKYVRNNIVFQTIKVFDIHNKKYISSIKDCFIFPCPVHEYVLLGEDLLLGLSEIRSHFVIWSLTTGQIIERIKTNFRDKLNNNTGDPPPEVLHTARQQTARMLPWKRRLETTTARQRRKKEELEQERMELEEFRREKENHIDTYVISKDHSTIVASFYARHLCVFDIGQRLHTHTFEDFNSLLLLHVSVLSPDGTHLALPHYDEEEKFSYVTMWNCKTGEVEKRIRNEKGVGCITMNDDSSQIIFGKTNGELRVWRPRIRRNPLKKIKPSLPISIDIGCKIYLIDNGNKAVVLSGVVSMWDLKKDTLLSIFTPDTPIECIHIAYNGHAILLGMRQSTELVTLVPKAIEMNSIPPQKLESTLLQEELEEDEKESEEED